MSTGQAGTLVRLLASLDGATSLEGALASVTDAALLLVGAEHASIRVLDDRDTELLSGARSGVGADSRPVTLGRGLGVVGWVIDEGRCARVGDTRTDARFVQFSGQGFEILSILAVPLTVGPKVVGVLSVTASAPDAFSEDDEALLRIVAAITLPAIERARQERQDVTDSRTRAFNRRYLLPKLRDELGRAHPDAAPLSVLVVDLDGLERVNERHGEKVGHQVLRVFADRVRTLVRRREVLVRRGDDDFVVIMPETGDDGAAAAAELIRREMSEHPIVVKHGPRIAQTVSVGVATWDGRESADELLDRADRALGQAKVRGSDSVSVDQALYDTQ